MEWKKVLAKERMKIREKPDRVFGDAADAAAVAAVAAVAAESVVARTRRMVGSMSKVKEGSRRWEELRLRWMRG